MISEISQKLDFHAKSHNLFAFYYLICMSLTTPYDIQKTVFLKLQVIHFFVFIFFSFQLCISCIFVMSQNVIFNENSQTSNFENRSNNFTLPVLTNLNKENLTHSADSLNLMFSDSDQSCKNSNADLDFEALIVLVGTN